MVEELASARIVSSTDKQVRIVFPNRKAMHDIEFIK